MMGMTHVFVGIVSAVAVAAPKSGGAYLAAVAGGTLGGILCDLDLKKKNRFPGVVPAGRLAVVILLICFALDWCLDTEMIRSIRRRDSEALMAGAVGLILLCVWSVCQPHRGGTHSILAMLLFGGCTELVCPMLSRTLMIGMISHLVLDLLNSKPLRLLYPLPGGYCLGLCKADGRLDRWLQMVGLWGTIFGSIICIGRFL